MAYKQHQSGRLAGAEEDAVLAPPSESSATSVRIQRKSSVSTVSSESCAGAAEQVGTSSEQQHMLADLC